MSTTLEHYCEAVEILLLQAQIGLSTFTITHEDDDSLQAVDRIIVKANPREPELPGYKQTIVQC